MAVRVHQMRLDLAQRIVLQIVEQQRAKHNQYQLHAADAEQHLQQHQFQVRQLQQNGQRQNDVPLLLPVLALLFATLCCEARRQETRKVLPPNVRRCESHYISALAPTQTRVHSAVLFGFVYIGYTCTFDVT